MEVVVLLNEILVDWSVPSGAPGVSVLFFEATAASVVDQRDAIQAAIAAAAVEINEEVRATVRNNGRVIEDSTGTLTAEWSDGAVQIADGTSAFRPVSNAAQVLIRWGTGEIVNGRFVRGRTFIPGCSSNATTEGQLGAGPLTTFSDAFFTLISANVGFGIWSRPKNGAGGSFHPALTASAWNELAVLRQRR
jgi:hypothetical protein